MNQQQLIGLTESHLTLAQTKFQTVKINTLIQEDLLHLVDAADKAGFQLEVASGFRNFERQKKIWNNKFSGKTAILDSASQTLDHSLLTDKERLFAILRWSALPGTSRHHWGTDLDIYAKNLLPKNHRLQLEPWEYLTGHQAPFYHWLKRNLTQFGFFFPYEMDLGGIAPEPWHISHVKISEPYLEKLSKSVIIETLEQQDVLGFSVINENFKHIYTHYVTNICRSRSYD
ncbi:M15 family metallopeptidase [Vibrio sp. TH_r3]|uniref:M15 family metallopeptidase n=1 Tax=Vibrio sp. TH_r3 TaxID=3082084 RepID=UPI00295505B1|nr:M15 family metallopeptidase [Vibrio sp. TH_r3]MDV7105078.1 M15 family metallopeptidase [Vibrio sp. TH_r3]